jgi:hypothetical protein
VTYLWSTGETTQSILIPASGSYWVMVTDAAGCTDSDTIGISIISGVVESVQQPQQISVYPNPAGAGMVTVEFDVAIRGNVELRIMDQLGKKIYSETLSDFYGKYLKQLNLHGLHAGLYLVEIMTPEGRRTSKLSIR